MKMFDDAITFFQLNVEAYPESPNSYDRLAVAYMKAGKTQLAITDYQKVLGLDPGNQDAANMLGKLRE